jgi:adenine-specific DNA-methyltransferase
MSETLRSDLSAALTAFAGKSLRTAARDLFAILGYASERALDLGSVSHFCKTYDSAGTVLSRFEPAARWKSIQLLFQLTSADIARSSGRQLELIAPDPADLSTRAIESYLFFALDLAPPADGKPRSRTDLCDLARALNRLFPMPALVLFKEGDKLSVAITYRRGNKKDRSKDVVERKVTLIKDISLSRPHPGHLVILEDFSLHSLSELRGRDIRTFADLDAAWRESLSVELLRRRAYRMLADWYFWAREHAQFPPDALPDADGKPSLHLIRLLTRVIFCWFVKEKSLPDGRSLLPYDLFDSPRIRELLKDSSPQAGTYYTAILQNLFFATLNTEMDPPAGSPATRRFARKVTADHMVHTLWRNDDQLTPAGRERLPALLRNIPFLNGGLFECLDDRVEIEGTTQTREVRVDGFSTNPAKQPRIPNFLFFGGDVRDVDLSAATGNSARAHVTVTPLLDILNSFVWTITESTPLEEEVALDPDLLGNVFENLLAAYNPETGTVARNATGSFYTPDYVVDWMIEQALEPLLLAALPPKTKKASARLRRLLDWDEPGHDFDPTESRLLIDAISRLRSLDPACGSGAYPMGLLKKMVRVLTKLDPDNSLWRARQLALAEQIDSAPAREEALAAIARAFSRNNDDYGRKLYLIENSIYGVDIQPLAVQIAKLRFFITLIVDQPIDPALPNYGILPLPNLETKIVPANTLLGLQRGQLLLGSDEVRALERELKTVRHRYFTARRYQDKKALRRRDRDLCKELATALVESGECTPSDAKRLVEWNPYNTNTHAGFFDPGWMFGLEGRDGAPGKFDLVIGNPPYVRQEELKAVTVRDSAGRQRPLKDVLKEQYECYTGTADLYVYFFERSLQLLRTGGVLSFITSNKYFRAGYGEKLRAYLLYATAPRVLLDFGDTDIFTAVAYPCILVTEKLRDVEKKELPDPKSFENADIFNQLVPHADRTFPVLAWKPAPAGGESKVDFPVIFDRDSFALRQRDLKSSSWTIQQGLGLSLVETLRKDRQSLTKCVGARVSRGLTTGYNDAFVISADEVSEIYRAEPQTKQFIHPYIRGKDIKRWRCEAGDLFIIQIPSSENQTHPWSNLPDKEAEKVFKASHPVVHARFSSFEHKQSLLDRYDQGRYYWELRSCQYYGDFEKTKILSTKISIQPTFCIDESGATLANTSYFFPSPSHPRFVLGLLNSSVFHAYARRVFVDKQGGWFEVQPTALEEFPIPAATPEQKALCEALSSALIELHKPELAGLPERGLVVSWFEQWMNGLVYELFFPGELHARGLHLFAETAKLLPDGKLPRKTIAEVFAASRDFKRPLRAMLTDLTTIEEVRLIEEAGR